jgi:thiamine biosynthesis lipoprotein
VPGWHFGAIGTQWTIDTIDPLDASIKTMISERIDEFDRVYSRFREDSVVTALSKEAQTVVLPDDAVNLFALYQKLYEATGGALSPLVGDTLNHLGYDASYRLRSLPGPAGPTPAFDDVVSLEGTTLTTYRPVTIDVGAVGKGYLVDIVAELLDDSGVTDYTVDASGDLRHRGHTPERVGLENPRDPDHVVGVAEVSNRALAASATNRRTWGDGLHHIVDALTGLPTRSIEATFVLSDTAAMADGLATALFVGSPEHLQRVGQFDWVIMSSDGSLRASPNFPGEVFSS